MPNAFSRMNIDTVSLRKKDVYHYADVVELRCLQNVDFQIPPEEALDELLGNDEAIGGIAECDSTNLYIDEYPDKDAALGRRPATERSDALNRYLADVESHIESRVRLFGVNYPFTYKDGLLVRKPQVNLSHKLYIFLLAASHLPFWDAIDRQIFTNDFEVLGALALQNLVPTWTCKLFGTARSTALAAYSGGPLAKLEAFAEELKLRLDLSDSEHARLNTPGGDAGLDAVTWHFPLADGAGNMPVILAQAGCSRAEEEMLSKQVNSTIWRSRIPGMGVLGCLITPQCYRNTDYTWPSPSRVHDVLLDRYRVLHLLADVHEAAQCCANSFAELEPVFAPNPDDPGASAEPAWSAS